MLHPLADALKAAMGPATRVWLATQGEMGATVVYYPASHRALLGSLKARIAAGQAPGAAARVATGVLTNADKLCQCIRQEGGGGGGGAGGGDPPPSYSAQFRAAWPQGVGAAFDAPAVRALFEAADFIGFSNYPTLPGPAVKPADLEAGLSTFALELAAFGVDLRALIARRGTALFFSEVGVGGGADAWGGNPTADPAAAAAAPFYGVTHSYSPDADPWHRPGQGPGMGAFLRSFYVALSQFAAARGTCAGCKFPGVDGVFLWNCGSWDVQGVHPSSWAGDDPAGAPGRVGGGGRPFTYRDAAIVGLIADHNAAAVGGGGGFGRVAPGDGGQQGGRAEGEGGRAPSSPHGGATPADASRAAASAESARLAAAMMAAEGGRRGAVEEEEGGDALPARPGLAGGGGGGATAAVRATTAPAAPAPARPAPHDLAAGAADGAFSSFAQLQEALLAAVDRLDLPGGGSGRAAVGEEA